MRYLLDTHLLVWMADDSPRLPDAAREAVIDAGNQVWFSAANIWEIVIKSSLGRLDVDARALARALVARGFGALEISIDDTLEIDNLESGQHRDPFDRMLVAQARARRMTLLTCDRTLARAYPGSPIEWHAAG